MTDNQTNGVPTTQDLDTARAWLEGAFPATVRRLPVSFRLGGKPFSSFVSRSEPQWAELVTEDLTSRRSCRLTDPETGLQLLVQVTAWGDFPAVEWVGHLRNTGAKDTPIISGVRALATTFPAAKEAPCRVVHALGSDCKIDDFAPRETALGAPGKALLAPLAGRSSEGALPFFNLDLGGRGVIGAIGWTGGWEVRFARRKDGPVRVRAGMRRTHFRLHPGEEVRTPRILLLFWEGDPRHGHNMLRQCLLRHYALDLEGKTLQAPVCYAAWGENRAERQLAKAKWWHDEQTGLECYWIDAGWHGDGQFLENSTVFNSTWYAHVGNWWPNKTTYPQGLGPIGKALREMGLGFVLWLEPERVFKETCFTREHPEWLLGPIGDNYLFNLGDPKAREALTDLVSGVIAEGGVTVYRQDFNMDPTPFWRAADAPDRVGISEIKHITGLYAFWDDLRRRHPGLLIDNCSSGGRRIDLETISRSIPLWRSDFQCFPGFDPMAMQGQTQGLAPWVPLSTGCCDRADTYDFRSALGPGIVISNAVNQPEPPPPYPAAWLRERIAELKAVRPYLAGDFHPLLPYSLATEGWAAWQFDRPDLGEGMVLAFRRQHSPFPTMLARLQDMQAEARYEVRSQDGSPPVTITGRELAEGGLRIEIGRQPGSALFIYRRL